MAATPDKDSPAVSGSPKGGPIASTSPIASAAGSNAGRRPVLRQLLEEEDEDMAPASRRELLHKDHFAFVFGSVKTQNYLDPVSKGPGSHTIRTLAWNPTGQLIATGSADRTLRIWNPERPHVRYSTELRGHTAGIEKALFNPVRDAELASCSADGTVRFWDVRSKTCV
ncbi:hypothetical protein HAV15_002903 [Penicillium sp. str. |nr:hypothetical protein HAV15_002903 [Penicillium sp. str. \